MISRTTINHVTVLAPLQRVKMLAVPIHDLEFVHVVLKRVRALAVTFVL